MPDDCLEPGDHHPPGRQAGMERAVFLVGDSHANALVPGMRKAVENKMSMAAAAGPGYRFRFACDRRFELLDLNVRKGDVVVVLQSARSSNEMNYASDGQIAFYRWALVPMLKARGAKLVLMQDWPAMKVSGILCRPPRGTSRCAYTEDDIANGAGIHDPGSGTIRSLTEVLVNFANEFPDTVYAFDQTADLLMQNGQGSNLIPGTRTNAYADFDHISHEGALYLAPYLCAAFDSWGFYAPVDSSPAPAPWRPAEIAALATVTNSREWCERVAVVFCVRVEDDWGLLEGEDDLLSEWADRDCNEKAGHVNTGPSYLFP
uniref:SGNH domain-containing protein n=1 Tax=Prymnesium polylepis TaxID=72548 RepID=A0A7S4IWY8_9EUKA